MARDINELVSKFTHELSNYIHAQVLNKVEVALGPRTRKMLAPILVQAKSPQKRSEEAMAIARQRILQAVKKVPGMRSEQIQALLKMTPSQLGLPLKQLCDEKALKFEGVARGRKYWIR
jgi:hypothetical protein